LCNDLKIKKSDNDYQKAKVICDVLTIEWFLAFFSVVASIQISPLSNTAQRYKK
jgi:hypothetical protein